MTCTAITPMSPPTSGRDVQGANKRFGMFLDALGQPSETVHIIRLVPEWEMHIPANDPAGLDDKESEHWKRDVRVTLIPRRTRKETTYNHYVAGMLRAGDQKNFFPYSGSEMAGSLAGQVDPDQLTFVHKLPAMCAVLATGLRPANMIFDLDDVEHRVRLRHAFQKPVWPGKMVYATHAPALFNAERRGAALSRATFVCSKQDRDHLTRLGLKRVVAVPNGVRLPEQAAPLADEKTIMFIGLMTYEPNIEAAQRLVREVMPLVWRRRPEARVLIAGQGSLELAEEWAKGGKVDDRVDTLGFVPDIDALYARSRVICCPLTNGGGTRIKLIEGAAYRKPMISTRMGAEGLDFVDGREILLRDDNESLAAACADLLEDDTLCEILGAAAYRKMCQLYEKSRISQRIRLIMNAAPAGPERALAGRFADTLEDEEYLQQD